MARYFLEVMYQGTAYNGFQIQENAVTIQSEVEKALETVQRTKIKLTGSSRTDTGVHALQNYFHFDCHLPVNEHLIYKLNAILPGDIAAVGIYQLPADAHCRFNATSRAYIYQIHQRKNPFLNERSYYYPYKLNSEPMREAAEYLLSQTNYFAFCKSNTQVKTFEAVITASKWTFGDKEITFEIEGNRFLRGMVRLLTGTLLKVGREKMTVDEFVRLFDGNYKCGHSVPPCGLYLKNVKYPKNLFDRRAVALPQK